ncbi:hypothetical protein [Sphingobium sp.]|uniref:hypothetical protein n=1 Tax=Sphingobium TaxID=165695 RepID=UPI001A22AF58|nr:hypothetical protein [Sphingobium sp.]MBJ7377684.1 hypothetical protein [Sphingobium sp.]
MIVELAGGDTFSPLHNIIAMATHFNVFSQMNPFGKHALPDERRSIAIKNLETLRTVSDALNFKASLASIDSAIVQLKDQVSGSLTPDDFNDWDEAFKAENHWKMSAMHIRMNAHVLFDVASRFCDEAKSTQFFAFANSNSAYHFNEESPFGNEVSDCFPDALFDIEEAAKCFSLSRYTACVYHVMRAAENAVAVLAERLGATYQSKNGETLSWGKLTSNIKAKIDEMERGTDQDDLLRAYMLLHSCNRAYRTKTAHPGIKYTQEEADTVLRSTKSFMSEMAGLVSNW